MGEFKDRHWDAKYDNFIRLKKQRMQLENSKSQATHESHPNHELNRNDGARNEERKFVSKGPSRFLKSHLEKTQKSSIAQSQSLINQSESHEEEKPTLQQIEVVPEEEKEGGKISFMDLLPYLFIVFAIVVLIFVLIKRG